MEKTDSNFRHTAGGSWPYLVNVTFYRIKKKKLFFFLWYILDHTSIIIPFFSSCQQETARGFPYCQENNSRSQQKTVIKWATPLGPQGGQEMKQVDTHWKITNQTAYCVPRHMHSMVQPGCYLQIKQFSFITEVSTMRWVCNSVPVQATCLFSLCKNLYTIL